MKKTAIVEMWDDKTISVYVPEMEKFSLNGQGKSTEEAKQALRQAVEDYKEMFAARGEDVPKELDGIEFEYKYDLASFFDSFRFISVSAFAKYADVNPSLMRQYKQRLAFASESQKAKIERAIHKAGKELATVRL